MTAVPLGHGAYKRLAAGTPEIQLENRWLEANPANPDEQSMLLSRPGTSQLATLGPSITNPPRAHFSKTGLFESDLFVIAGQSLYRLSAANDTITPIAGIVSATDTPQCTWMKGIGYEYLFIAAGDQLQVYQGISAASNILTLTGTITSGSDVLEIGGVYYTWHSVVSSGNGTLATPYRVNFNTTLGAYDPMKQLMMAIMASGTPGVDYSPGITIPNAYVRASTNGGTPATSLTITALVPGTNGNAITTTTNGGAIPPPSPNTLVATTDGNQTFTGPTSHTFTCNVNASGGSSPYTYSWTIISTGGTGSGAFTTATNTPTVQYTATCPSAGNSFVAYIKCVVMDANFNKVDSNTTQLLFTYG